MRKGSLLLTTLALAGCAGASLSPRASGERLSGGAQGPSAGFATILAAQPSPWPTKPPPAPSVDFDSFTYRTSDPDPDVRRTAWEEANGPADLQAEMQRVAPSIRSGEGGNFVELRLVRDPAVAVEVWFERDAAATLAKYTADPRFRPRQGGIDLVEGMELNRLWWKRFEDAGVPYSGGVSNLEGTIDFEILVTETEYREMIRGRPWGDATDPRLRLTFVDPQPSAFADPSLEPLVRAFARQDAATSIVLTSATTGTVALSDGCFRLGGAKGPLVMFERNAQLDRDDEGYLVIRTGDAIARVGEPAVWGGYPRPRESEADVRALRRACGRGELVNVGAPMSLRLSGLPDPAWVVDYARAKRLSYAEAWGEVIACMKREEGPIPSFLGARDACIDQFNDR